MAHREPQLHLRGQDHDGIGPALRLPSPFDVMKERRDDPEDASIYQHVRSWDHERTLSKKPSPPVSQFLPENPDGTAKRSTTVRFISVSCMVHPTTCEQTLVGLSSDGVVWLGAVLTTGVSWTRTEGPEL